MNALLLLDTKLFLEACEVKALEGDEAQEVVADCLVADDLALDQEP